MLGEVTEDGAIVGIENAFAEGSDCAIQYEIMWDAYNRLLDRLGQRGEDPDVEIMRGALSAIQRELCYRIYQYGVLYGRE